MRIEFIAVSLATNFSANINELHLGNCLEVLRISNIKMINYQVSRRLYALIFFIWHPVRIEFITVSLATILFRKLSRDYI